MSRVIIAKAIRKVNTFGYLTKNNLGYRFESMKKETFADRLNMAMKEAGYSQASLGHAVNMSQPSVWKLTSGATKHTRKLFEIATVLGVNTEWLASGSGPMRVGGEQPVQFQKNNNYRIEVLDLKVSAGPGTYMISDVVEVLTAIEFTNDHARSLFGNRKSKDIKVMTVDGDSMCPTVQSGDRLFFDISVREFTTDGLYAFVFGKTFHVKRLQMQGLKLAVLSDNEVYKDWFINESEQDQLYIMGKALLLESIQYGKL